MLYYCTVYCHKNCSPPDAKRDIRDLGMGAYAERNCYNLGKLSYGSLISGGSGASSSKSKKKGKKSKAKANTGTYDEGVMFATYSTLIGKSRTGTRLDQLVEWCCGGGDPESFDGLIMFDECHKAKTIDLDAKGNATNVGKGVKCSQTAAKVVELQNLLPRARIVYCSATSVSEPKNLGFMSRLGLWGPGKYLSCIRRVASMSNCSPNTNTISFLHRN